MVEAKTKEFLKSLGKREEFKKEHGFVPSNVTFSPTYWCNWHCKDCYSDSSGTSRDELGDGTIDRAIEESRGKWAVPFYTITGGESLFHAVKIARRHPKDLFFLYTNGTLMTKKIAGEIAELGNLFPTLSIRGSQKETDEVRGKGTYDLVQKAMEALSEKGVVWGVSFTLTSENSQVYDNDKFLDSLRHEGALFGRFLTYMPTGRDSDFQKVPTKEQRKKQGETLGRLNKSKKGFYAFDYLNNPDTIRGCAAGGLRYVHIEPNGDVNPCVFIPTAAKYNLKAAYNGEYANEGISCLEDILVKDPILKVTRQVAKKRDDYNCCLVIDNPTEIKKAYEGLNKEATTN